MAYIVMANIVNTVKKKRVPPGLYLGMPSAMPMRGRMRARAECFGADVAASVNGGGVEGSLDEVRSGGILVLLLPRIDADRPPRVCKNRSISRLKPSPDCGGGGGDGGGDGGAVMALVLALALVVLVVLVVVAVAAAAAVVSGRVSG